MTPLSAPIPLRNSSVWAGYREAVAIPHRYGSASGSLIQYNATRTQFVWCDHAAQSIDTVLVGGQSVGDWVWRNTVDSTGHTVTMVEFGQPQDEGATLFARGRGKRHPADGRAMTNPADVIWDVLANLAGRDITSTQLTEFRNECVREGVEVGGSIDSEDSVQSVVRAICASVGAIYCADMPGLCKLWPGVSTPSPRITIKESPLTAGAAMDRITTELTIRFAHEGRQPRGSVRMDAPDAVARLGLRSDTIDAPWITSYRVAVAVGKRLLQQRARKQWAIQFKSTRALSVGDGVTLSHPMSPATGTHMVLSRETNLDTGAGSASVLVPVGDAPVVRLVNQSSAFDPAQYANAIVTNAGADRILTLVEQDGRPIANAAVTLDGGIVRYTDSAGRVSFPVSSMPAGEHVLAILTEDGRTLTMTVLIT